MRTLASYESTDHDEIARRIPVGGGHTVNRFFQLRFTKKELGDGTTLWFDSLDAFPCATCGAHMSIDIDDLTDEQILDPNFQIEPSFFRMIEGEGFKRFPTPTCPGPRPHWP